MGIAVPLKRLRTMIALLNNRESFLRKLSVIRSLGCLSWFWHTKNPIDTGLSAGGARVGEICIQHVPQAGKSRNPRISVPIAGRHFLRLRTPEPVPGGSPRL